MLHQRRAVGRGCGIAGITRSLHMYRQQERWSTHIHTIGANTSSYICHSVPLCERFVTLTRPHFLPRTPLSLVSGAVGDRKLPFPQLLLMFAFQPPLFTLSHTLRHTSTTYLEKYVCLSVCLVITDSQTTGPTRLKLFVTTGKFPDRCGAIGYFEFEKRGLEKLVLSFM